MTDTFIIQNKWQVKPDLNRIYNGDSDIQIPPKYMEVLVCLAKNSGQVMSRDELLDTIWKDAIVVEETLTRAISELRKIFDDDPKKPFIIETIPKKGYRLIAPVQWTDSIIAKKLAKGDLRHRRKLFFLYFAGFIFLFINIAFFMSNFFIPKQPAASPIRLMPVTTYPGDESHPVLSPDGTRLAFRWEGVERQNPCIYVKNIGSEHSLQLTMSGSSTEPAWSPDGQFISYVKLTDQGRVLYTIPSMGGPERRVFESITGIRNPVWLPDASGFVFSLYDDETGAFSLYSADIDTGIQKQLTWPGLGPTVDFKPVISPEKTHIAFIRTYFGKRDIYIIDISGNHLKKMTQTDQWISDVDWSPDGKNLIYASREGIWKLPISGEPPALLAAGGMVIDNISVARTSWRLAYELATRQENVWYVKYDRNSNELTVPEKLIASSRVDADPVISPNKEKIAFISNRSGNPQLWITNINGTSPMQLTRFTGGAAVNHPTWSYDSKRIVFAAMLHGNSDLFIIDTEGGAPAQLTRVETNDIRPYWSRNNKNIYFSSNRENGWNVWRKPVRGGNAVRLTENGGFRPRESKDRTSIYYHKQHDGKWGIWQMNLRNRQESELFHLTTGFFVGWDILDDGIIFGWRDIDNVMKIGYYDFSKEAIEHVMSTDRPGFYFSASMDGMMMLFTQVDRNESDIILLENFR